MESSLKSRPLPDAEMRKFLRAGTVDSLRDALKNHVFHGLEILELTSDACLIRLDATEVMLPTSQSLKQSVKMANALFGIGTDEIRQRDSKTV